MSTDTSRAADGYRYDVFISYRQREPDKSWVRKQLFPALRDAGLRVCIDFRDFRLGAQVLTEMERAVVESRYTLAVLSPQYLESSFTELESILGRQAGLEGRSRRFLAVMRTPCQVGLDLRSRLWLDMSQDEDFADNIERLARELSQPAT